MGLDVILAACSYFPEFQTLPELGAICLVHAWARHTLGTETTSTAPIVSIFFASALLRLGNAGGAGVSHGASEICSSVNSSLQTYIPIFLNEHCATQVHMRLHLGRIDTHALVRNRIYSNKK